MPKKDFAPISAEIAAAETVPLDPRDIQRAPEQWAAEMFPASPSGRPHADLWKHAAADALHQWSLFRMVTGQPALLDQQTYLAALEAAANTFSPHPAADYSAKRKG